MRAGSIVGIITALEFTVNNHTSITGSGENNGIAWDSEVIPDVEINREGNPDKGNDAVFVVIAGGHQ
jgi:hypothetical protein